MHSASRRLPPVSRRTPTEAIRPRGGSERTAAGPSLKNRNSPPFIRSRDTEWAKQSVEDRRETRIRRSGQYTGQRTSAVIYEADRQRDLKYHAGERRRRTPRRLVLAVSSMTLVIDPTMLDMIAHASATIPTMLRNPRRRAIGTGSFRASRHPLRQHRHGDRRRNFARLLETLLATQRDARHACLQIVGFYHSHPDGSTRPTWRDLENAWADCSYLILAVSAGRYIDSASWRTNAPRRSFEPESVTDHPLWGNPHH